MGILTALGSLLRSGMDWGLLLPHLLIPDLEEGAWPSEKRFLLSFRAAPVRDSSFIEKMKKTVSLLWLCGVLGRWGSSCLSLFPLSSCQQGGTGLNTDISAAECPEEGSAGRQE